MNKKRTIIALVAVLAALVIFAGIALAATVTRQINVHFYEALALEVSPELDVPIDIPYGGNSTITYTVSNPTPEDYNVHASQANGNAAGVVVSITPNDILVPAGGSEDIIVTITNSYGTPSDCSVLIAFEAIPIT